MSVYCAEEVRVGMANGRPGRPRKSESQEPPVTHGGESRLMSRRVFSGSDGTEDHWRDVHFVYNNLFLEDVRPEDAPSPGAWFWLQEVRSSQEALDDFRSFYMKLAPSRKELDERARRSDTGENVENLIRQVEVALGVAVQ